MRLLPLLLLLACSGGGEGKEQGGEGGGTDDEEVRTDPRTLVEVATAGPGAVADHVLSSAVVESEAQANIVPETQGVVTGIHVEEGDHVERGQLLAVLASPTLDAAYQRASAELERTTREAASAERLASQGAIPASELEAARHALSLARSAQEEASRTRGFTRLESPIAGTVASRNVRYGEVASPPQPAFTIVDLDRLRVIISLPERDLLRVRAGQPATLASAYDPTATASGRVLRVAPVVDATSGTVRVTVMVDPGQLLLRPGQFVNVSIEVDRHEDVLTVPRRALVWEEGQPYVYTVSEMTREELEKEKKDEDGEGDAGKEGGGGGFAFKLPWEEDEKEEDDELPGVQRKATRVGVKLGFLDGERAELTEGIADGTQVVTVGNAALRDGGRVRLTTDPTLARAEKKEDEG
jgi:membrane fusion protein (multidrug efflux system)